MLAGPFDLVALILSTVFDNFSIEMLIEHRVSSNGRSGKSDSSTLFFKYTSKMN